MGKEWTRMNTCICISESLCCIHETNTTFKSTILHYKTLKKDKEKMHKDGGKIERREGARMQQNIKSW